MAKTPSVSVQIISKIIDTGDYSIIEENDLEKEYFIGYEEQIDFISKHYEEYGNVPDDLTFERAFPGFDLYEVRETDKLLVKELIDNYLTHYSLDMINESVSKKQNGHDAEDLPSDLAEKLTKLSNSVKQGFEEVALFNSIDDRIRHTDELANNVDAFYIPTGFAEIDRDIQGLQKGNELAVIYARTNNGKSWVAEYMSNFEAEIGLRVGYFSPEMSPLDLGYRLDSLHGHLSNNAIRLGRYTDEFTDENYKEYGKSLKKINGDVFVTTPKSFKRKVTVSKIKRWIKHSNLDIVFIDGIKYMTDERYKRGDSTTTSLTNISEDLMEMSGDLRVPVVIVVQANRGGVVDKNSLDTPELENIRDSDGIAQNASIVWAIRKVTRGDETFLLIDNKKARNGENGQSYKYRWLVDTGEIEYVSPEDIPNGEKEDESYSQYIAQQSTGANKRKRRNLEDEM